MNWKISKIHVVVFFLACKLKAVKKCTRVSSSYLMESEDLFPLAILKTTHRGMMALGRSEAALLGCSLKKTV